MPDIFTILMLVVLAVLIFFMFRNSRKRQSEARELQSKVQPGADVMTNFGLFGTVVSIDETDNKVVLEVSPGSQVTVHRQTVARVVTPSVVDEAAEEEPELDAEPEFGERIESSTEAPKPDADGSADTSKKHD